MNNKTKAIIILVLVFSIALTFSVTLKYGNIKLKNEIEKIENFNKYYSKALTEFNYGVFEDNNANYNYDLWSFYHDEGYYYDSIDYCVSARDLYASANSYYQDSISNFEESNKSAKEIYQGLIGFYIMASNQAIELNWAMYEACEYFESASNYYSRELWETGNIELEIGNEKIVLHDSLVRDYNKYISKIEILETNL